MDVMSFGIDYSTRRRLTDSIDEQRFSELILDSFPHETLDSVAKFTTRAHLFKAEVERTRFPDLGDPASVGWKFLVSNNDPLKDEIIKAVEPLAKHRGMTDPSHPLIYTCQYESEWWDWMRNNCWSLAMDEAPYYVLIIGGPEQVPFRFQSMLDSTSAVGRIQFDSVDDLKEYVKKVIRLEKASNPVVKREAIMFAPDWGVNDPTFFSRTFMSQPLSTHIKDDLNFKTKELFEDDATKKNLIDTIDDSAPALVYTASHGLGAPKEHLSIQKKYNGAICCQDMQTTGGTAQQGIYSADDVLSGKAYLEGSVFFEFSCFGYGTPKRSDFCHWIGDSSLNATEDFISALPKKLLAHPRGPIGFFGHVDTAWLHGFADPNNPYILERWHSRLAPFKKAVDEILRVQTLGLVLNAMNKGYDIGSAMLTNTYDRLKSGSETMTPEKNSKLVEYWITRTDAQNYMLFGDPGTHLRIP